MSAIIERVNRELLELSREHVAGHINSATFRARRRETIRWLYQSADTQPKASLLQDRKKIEASIDTARVADRAGESSKSKLNKGLMIGAGGLVAIIIVIALLLKPSSSNQTTAIADAPSTSAETVVKLSITEQAPFDIQQLDAAIQVVRQLSNGQRQRLSRDIQTSTLGIQLHKREETLSNLDTLNDEQKLELDRIRLLMAALH